MASDKNKNDYALILYGLVFVFFLVMLFVQPYHEAQTFNRMTGGNATYWDAFWAELRIDGSSQVIRNQQDNQ